MILGNKDQKYYGNHYDNAKNIEDNSFDHLSDNEFVLKQIGGKYVNMYHGPSTKKDNSNVNLNSDAFHSLDADNKNNFAMDMTKSTDSKDLGYYTKHQYGPSFYLSGGNKVSDSGLSNKYDDFTSKLYGTI